MSMILVFWWIVGFCMGLAMGIVIEKMRNEKKVSIEVNSEESKGN